MLLKTKRREQVALLLAEDRFSDVKIGKLAGVSPFTIAKWKQRPDVKARVAELTQIFADKALKEGLAQRDRRVAVLFQYHEKLRQIVDERAADPEMATIPGGKTGLVTRQMKGIGKGKEFRLVEHFVPDTRLVKELRACGEQIARELGQWQERVEVEDAGLADRLARARQREPLEPVTEQPVVVVEQELEIPAAEWPN
jgi:alpha-D-ribose 1-methylphosphonate 5-triphosphate synthase subunit PhnG